MPRQTRHVEDVIQLIVCSLNRCTSGLVRGSSTWRNLIRRPPFWNIGRRELHAHAQRFLRPVTLELDYSRAPFLGADQKHVGSGNEIDPFVHARRLTAVLGRELLSTQKVVVGHLSFRKSNIFKVNFVSKVTSGKKISSKCFVVFIQT